MSEKKEEAVFYICPNKCADTFFYRSGTAKVSQKLTETGEVIEENHYDFTPDSPVKCRKCHAEAKVGKKITTTTIEIIEEQ